MALGFESKDDETGALLVMKLLKTLYGLRQSPKNWHGIIDTFIVEIELKGLKFDPCVYIFDGMTNTGPSPRPTT